MAAKKEIRIPAPSLKALQQAFPKANILRFKAGEEIFAANTQAHSVFYVIGGRVQIYRKLRNGHRLELATLGKSDFLGEMALLAGGKRSANAKALGPVKVLEIPTDAFVALVKKGHPVIHQLSLYTSILLAERMQNLLELLVEEAERRPPVSSKKPVAFPEILRQLYANCAV